MNPYQIEYDNEVDRWYGIFFRAQVNRTYIVPHNASNHPEHRGRYGICVDYNETDIGMSWARIDFFGDKDDAKKVDWIRTNCLVPKNNFAKPEVVAQEDHEPNEVKIPHKTPGKVEDPLVKFSRVWK